MRYFMTALLAIGLAGGVYAADGDQAAGGNQGGGRGGRQGFGGPGGPGGFGGGMMGRDAMREAVSTLGEASLTPDFTLTKEQKEKIQAIRDEYKKATEKWRTEHEADLKKLRDQASEAMRGAAGGGGGGREKMQEIMKARQDLQATAPKAEEYVKQIKAVLTETQVKAFDATQTQRQQEAEKARTEMMERFGGGRGGMRGGGAGGDGAGGGAAPGGGAGGRGGRGGRGGGAGGAAGAGGAR